MKRKEKSPYSIIISRHSTEKAAVLEGLKDSESNRSVSRCENPRYVFRVDTKANKSEIARSIETIYEKQGVKVVSVNTINVKPKVKRRRGRPGQTSGFKKAVVTLATGDSLDNV